MGWGDFFSLDTLLGGAGADSSPQHYYTPYHDRDTIMNSINAGLNTNRQAPTDINSVFRNAQLNQMSQLQGIASGQQMGAGELAARRQAANAMAQQQAMARMARGGNAALAQRNAANQGAAIGLSAAGMGQQAAMQDQMQAQGLLSNVAQQGRQSDLANMDMRLRQMGMDDQARLGYLQQLTGMNANELSAQMGAQQNAFQRPGLLGPLIGAGGQIGAAAAMPSPAAAGAAASDERVKQDIEDAADDIDEMLDKLTPKAFRYKEPQKWGEGRRTGFMAQDLEKSKTGRDMVREEKDGTKVVDINKMITATLASAARINQRLRQLEKKAG